MYKIIASYPVKGIERSLIYEFSDKGVAETTVKELDKLFPGYTHRTYEVGETTTTNKLFKSKRRK